MWNIINIKSIKLAYKALVLNYSQISFSVKKFTRDNYFCSKKDIFFARWPLGTCTSGIKTKSFVLWINTSTVVSQNYQERGWCKNLIKATFCRQDKYFPRNWNKSILHLTSPFNINTANHYKHFSPSPTSHEQLWGHNAFHLNSPVASCPAGEQRKMRFLVLPARMNSSII